MVTSKSVLLLICGTVLYPETVLPARNFHGVGKSESVALNMARTLLRVLPQPLRESEPGIKRSVA